ncbi:MAG: hypothetical protein A2Y62_11665 [Candidatus Fischerbacteria bacterium RBG_13_37_8]|uniref:GAF domain-containing protein n=1 Tax=Candidatus Fischerbacteria bacterium RBG_13_37_8 TaxID=1817863 RepID=A0A1F5VGI9_9BACT|nr:MAG: hypothetical protein A2Y62_11665 [Candidatus Fischerbacteria bacterium RBG_13_37_8]
MKENYQQAKLELIKKLPDIKDFEERIKLVVDVLKEHIEKYHWVGIYMKDNEELLLHYYVGLPTIHIRIPISEGICGAAVRERQTVVVDDVLKDPRYIACSLGTRSEIVVPIYKGDDIVGEIDIDSDIPSAFTEGDKEFLENIAIWIVEQ